MELRDLEYFDAIARTQNLGQAAELVGRTKPALVKCIRRLEKDVGAPLLVRSGRGIMLTSVGRILQDRAGSLRSNAVAVLREIRDFAEGSIGHVRLGLGATPAQEILPDVTAKLIAAMPKVTMEIVVGINNALRDALRAGQLDLIVCPIDEHARTEFCTHPLLNDVVVIVACSDHPIFAEPVELEKLAAFRWVLPAPPATQRMWLEEIFRAHGMPSPQVQIETNSLFMLPRLIARTQLLSFIPRHHVASEFSLQEIELEATTMARSLGVMYRKDTYLSPAALRVIDLLRENGHHRPGRAKIF